MKKIDSCFDFVDILSSSSTGSHGGHFNIFWIDIDVNFVALGHDCDGSCRCMDATLRFCCWHSLNTVHSSLPLEFGINHFPFHFHHDILVASIVAGRFIDYHSLPSLRNDVFSVHIQQIASKNGGLRASRPSSNFQHDVSGVVGILGQKQNFHPRLELLQLWFDFFHFRTRHFFHLWIITGFLKQFLRAIQLFFQLTVFIECQNDFFGLSSLGHDPLQQFRVRQYIRVSQSLRQSLVRTANSFQPTNHGRVYYHGKCRG
mmetsp:Transcript_95091/g.266256  ORF Transcript_95091/g.266256 Transcript_95091/m.266256 type:complete len:259 (+) Transcript_95091:424-1200(+)